MIASDGMQSLFERGGMTGPPMARISANSESVKIRVVYGYFKNNQQRVK